MHISMATFSEIGGRTRNEDACGVWSSGDRYYCVIADGAGGHKGGDRASRLAVESILAYFQNAHDCTPEILPAVLQMANQVVVDGQVADESLSDMRTTIVVLTLDTVNGSAVWGHVGDSRLYHFRHNQIIYQTKDHSVVQQMVEAGFLKPEDVRRSPSRNQLLAALGSAPEQFQYSVEAQPHLIESGDVFLLCTDGCWECMEESELEQALQASTSAEEWLQRIKKHIADAAKKKQDNYSAIAVWCDDPHKTQLFTVR